MNRQYHRFFVWPALLGLIVFVLSGFLHILVTWTGPQTTVSKPPQHIFDASHLQAIPSILKSYNITEASVIKMLPTETAPLLQITENRMAPRRYFDPRTGQELPDYDEKQARWLANYYLTEPYDDANYNIKSVSFQTTFDDEYPWVNRLLPVYKVVYEGDSGLTLYVHTETLALANISNNWKRDVQKLFQQLHTWQWMKDYPVGRIVLMMIFLSCLCGILLTGMTLLVMLGSPGKRKYMRRWHRVLGYIVCLPLFGFVASGTYHLLYSEYAQTQRDFNLSQPLLIDLDTINNTPVVNFSNAALHGVSLIRARDQLFYRASLAEQMSESEHEHHDANTIRNQRFDGIPKEQEGVYLALAVDEGRGAGLLTDERVARQLAMDYVHLTAESIISAEKITHFGPDYDFRNKRLPVWRIAIDNEQDDVLFIDVASGLLVDRVNGASRIENYSFSFLHKWNFLTFPIGREKRDALIVVVLSLALLLAFLGARLRIKPS